MYWIKAGALPPPKKKHAHTHTHRPFISLISLIWTGKNGRKKFHPHRLSGARLWWWWRWGGWMPRWKANAKQFNKKSDLNAPFIEPTMAAPTIGLRFAPWRRLFLMPQKEWKLKKKKLKTPKLTRLQLWATMIFNAAKLTDTMTLAQLDRIWNNKNKKGVYWMSNMKCCCFLTRGEDVWIQSPH